jgi:thioredoxin-like negative regulator of GroEL
MGDKIIAWSNMSQSSSNSKTIITYFESREQFKRLLSNNPGLIILKMGASWCRPCTTIKPIVDHFFASSPDNVVCCDVDVDESFDLYSYFRSKKMVNGIPAILCFKKENVSYIPDDSVTGAEPSELDAFFRRCGLHLLSIRK